MRESKLEIKSKKDISNKNDLIKYLPFKTDGSSVLN